LTPTRRHIDVIEIGLVFEFDKEEGERERIERIPYC
jgi:hypothetical protein